MQACTVSAGTQMVVGRGEVSSGETKDKTELFPDVQMESWQHGGHFSPCTVLFLLYFAVNVTTLRLKTALQVAGVLQTSKT